MKKPAEAVHTGYLDKTEGTCYFCPPVRFYIYYYGNADRSTMMMHTAVLCLGGNIRPRRRFLDRAVQCLAERVGTIVQTSSVYETEAWGFRAPAFLNRTVVVETGLSPEEVLHVTQAIERQLGRTRKTDGAYASRTVDIDILFYDNAVINVPGLQIPHPRIAERRFVLTGLEELMPDFVHPIHKKNIRTLYEQCPDTLRVRRLPNG